MNRVEGYITAHIGDNINECDDNFSISFNKCSFAVADGSSSDFFSKIYSRLLSDAFIENASDMFEEAQIKAINDHWRLLVREKLDKAGCKPGSFPFVRFQKMDPGCSTLIGLKLFNDGNLVKFRCSGLGDSVLFFIPEGASIPAIQFSSDSNKDFSLDQDVKFGYTPVISRSYSTQWLDSIIHLEGVLEKGTFFLMTDGLAEWILRKDDTDLADKFELLRNIQSQEDFILYVNNIRNRGAHNDDMTLVKIHIESLQLEFSESESVIFDYRSEQEKIELEEDEKRLSIAKTSAPKVQVEPIAKPNPNSDLIAAAISKVSEQKKQKEIEELIKGENATQSLIDAAKAKVASTSVQDEKQNINEKTADIIQQEEKAWKTEKEEEIEQLTQKLKKEKEEEIEQLTQKLNKEKEEEIELLTQKFNKEKDEALSEVRAEFLRIEEDRKKKEQEELEEIQQEEKKIKNKIFKYSKEIIICILLLISSISILCRPYNSENNYSHKELENQITDLQQQHSSDSLKINSLEVKNQELLKQNRELMQNAALYNRRMQYLQSWPQAYKETLKVK